MKKEKNGSGSIMAGASESPGSKKRKRDAPKTKGAEGRKTGEKGLSRKFQSQVPEETKNGKKKKVAMKSSKSDAGDSEKGKKGVSDDGKSRRLAAKEMAESRKKKRKRNYVLEKDLALLWEKMRSHNVNKEDRSKLVSEALKKIDGKYVEIVGSHVSARVLQTCVKYCSQAERDSVFEALRSNLLVLSQKKYAVHLVKKLLECANKKQLEWFITSLHGRVASLLRHTVASTVVDYAFHLANGTQKQSLLMEMYSTEFQLFKDLTLSKSCRLVDIISKFGLQKSLVLQHMITVIQPLLSKGIVEHSIIHKALLEFFTIADKSSAEDVIQQLLPLLVHGTTVGEEDQKLSGGVVLKQSKTLKKSKKEPLLIRMCHSWEGVKLCILCLKHSSAKERKKIVKSMKGYVRRLALDQYGSLFLVCVLSVVDDTKLVNKIVLRELQVNLKELVLDKNGIRSVLQLLHPRWPRFFGPELLACLDLCVPSLTQSDGMESLSELGPDQTPEVDGKVSITADEKDNICRQNIQLEGKKDPYVRRHELLVESGLAEYLLQTCIENVGELLQSKFGKDMIYKVAVGGTDNILQTLSSRLDDLYKAIASLAALPKITESDVEHVFENFHSSWVIKKLVLDRPVFAATLWKMALGGKCSIWAQGHSNKVILAYLESSDSEIRDMAKAELQPLIDSGDLRAPSNKPFKKDE